MLLHMEEESDSQTIGNCLGEQFVIHLRYVQRVDSLDKKDLEDVQQVYQAQQRMLACNAFVHLQCGQFAVLTGSS